MRSGDLDSIDSAIMKDIMNEVYEVEGMLEFLKIAIEE